MTAKKKAALGRGLGALLESPQTDITTKDVDSGKFVAGAVASIPLNQIETNPFQPRTEFEKVALQELSDSIKEQGIIQPITVRKLGYDKYQLISGERRFRAAQLAGLKDMPAFIRIANDNQMLEMALVENIQRENLNAMEIAISYQRLMDECVLTQEKLSERVGKKRSTITNYLRLLKLPAEIQVAIRDGHISMGHARALINIDDKSLQLILLEQAIQEELSVREVERRAREAVNGDDDKKRPSAAKTSDLPEKYSEFRDSFSQDINSKIDIKRNKKGAGSIVISFKSDDELERLIEYLRK